MSNATLNKTVDTKTPKLIILDRDGVINIDSPDFIRKEEAWHPIPGSLEAIAKLNRAGYKISVATNQSGIGRGLYSLTDLDEIHQKMTRCLAEFGGEIDGVFFCPHLPTDDCQCRKPRPGLFEQIAAHHQLDFKQTQVFCIGDTLRDLQAAASAGGYPLLVLTGNGHDTLLKLNSDDSLIALKNTPYFSNLATAVNAILEGTIG